MVKKLMWFAVAAVIAAAIIACGSGSDNAKSASADIAGENKPAENPTPKIPAELAGRTTAAAVVTDVYDVESDEFSW